MIKEKIDSNDLKIYELYIKRIMKEGDWFWARYNISFAINSGTLIIIGYMLRPSIESNNYISDNTRFLALAASLLGILFSFSWYLIALDGERWQAVITKTLSLIEDHLFELEADNIKLFNNIRIEFETKETYNEILKRDFLLGNKIMGIYREERTGYPRSRKNIFYYFYTYMDHFNYLLNTILGPGSQVPRDRI